MALVRLIYTSNTTAALSGNALQKIIDSSRRNNSRQFITGCLFFNKNHIVQYLEGGAEQVNRLYNRLAQDDRHANVQLVDCARISKRMFDGPAQRLTYFLFQSSMAILRVNIPRIPSIVCSGCFPTGIDAIAFPARFS